MVSKGIGEIMGQKNDKPKDDDFSIVEIKGAKFVKIGNWLFDPFLIANGALGITVYEPGSDPHNDEGKCVDVFVDQNMEVRSC